MFARAVCVLVCAPCVCMRVCACACARESRLLHWSVRLQGSRRRGAGCGVDEGMWSVGRGATLLPFFVREGGLGAGGRPELGCCAPRRCWRQVPQVQHAQSVERALDRWRRGARWPEEVRSCLGLGLDCGPVAGYELGCICGRACSCDAMP